MRLGLPGCCSAFCGVPSCCCGWELEIGAAQHHFAWSHLFRCRTPTRGASRILGLVYGVHLLRLSATAIVSLIVSAISALFNWHAMRRGTLLVGNEGRGLRED